MIEFLCAISLGTRLLSAKELLPAAFHACMVLALAVGGARLLWLFLSPIPRTIETIQRSRLLTIGRFAPLLILVGCGGVVGFVGVVLSLKAAPHVWWNIFPFLAAYALGFIGACAILFGIVTQSNLVDAYRGFDLKGDSGNLQRNFDAAMLAAFGVVMLAVAGWRWVPAFDADIAERTAFDAQRLITRVPFHLAILATLVRTYQVARDTALDTGKASNHLVTGSWIALVFVASKTFDGVLPRDSAVDDFLARRGQDGDLILKMVPIGYAHA